MLELQPRDVRGRRGGDAGGFLGVHEAVGAEVEGRGRGVGEVVVADGHQALRDAGQRDLERGRRDLVEDGGVRARDAGGVVQGGEGADGDGD